MRSPVKLKYCPFCGGTPRLIKTAANYHVECENCLCETFSSCLAEIATDHWNKRTPLDMLKVNIKTFLEKQQDYAENILKEIL